MAPTPRLYGKKGIVNGCKTVRVASNGIKMRVFSPGEIVHALVWQWILALERADTPRKT